MVGGLAVGAGGGDDGSERQWTESNKRQATMMKATICFGKVHHTPQNSFN